MNVKPDKTADIKPAKDEKPEAEDPTDEEPEEVLGHIESPTVQKTGDVREKQA